MHSATVLLLVAALVGFAASNPAKSVAYRGHKVLSITPKNPEELELLKGLEANEDLSLDFWTDPVAVGKEVGETKNSFFYFTISSPFSLTFLLNYFPVAVILALSPCHFSLPLLHDTSLFPFFQVVIRVSKRCSCLSISLSLFSLLI